MKLFICALIGYILGALNPSALISKLKKDDLRHLGTGNLGATNVTMIYGRLWGGLVMLFDILKSFAAFKISQYLIFQSDDELSLFAGMLASGMAVLGHIFPFYMKFKGGKGVAAFAGMVLAYSPLLLLILIVVCFLLMVLFNYGFMLTVSAVVLFCIITTVIERSVYTFSVTAIVALLVIYKHIPNIRKAGTPDEIRARDYMRKHIFKR